MVLTACTSLERTDAVPLEIRYDVVANCECDRGDGRLCGAVAHDYGSLTRSTPAQFLAGAMAALESDGWQFDGGVRCPSCVAEGVSVTSAAAAPAASAPRAPRP